ncbi:hypothetical protein Tco_1479527, partial [Tanacetum coccineum]
VMSSSTVTYTSIPSDSDLPQWGFHLMDPDEFEAPQSLEQAPPSPDLYPTMSTKEDPEEDLEEDLADYPTDGGDEEEQEEEASEEDEAEDESTTPTKLCLTTCLLTISPSAEEQTALIAEYASSPTPPSPPPSPLSLLLSSLPQIPSLPLPLPSPPLLLPSTTHRTDIPKAKIACLVRGLVYCSTWFPVLSLECRVMTDIWEVNERVTDLDTTQRRYFRSMASSYKREAVYARQAWSCSEDKSTILEALIGTQEARTTSLEAQVGTLWTQHDRLEWQR